MDSLPHPNSENICVFHDLLQENSNNELSDDELIRDFELENFLY